MTIALICAMASPGRTAVCERTDVPTLLAEGKSVPGRVWCARPQLNGRRLDDRAPGISAAACVSGSLCVVASDETRFAQIVRLDLARYRIVPLRFIHLADTPVTRNGNDSKAVPELDIEAAAAIGDRIVLAGSHGLSRQGSVHPERYSLFNIDLDEARLDRWPVHRLRDDPERKRNDGVVPLVDSGDTKVGLVRRILEMAPASSALKAAWDRCLQDNGFNLEGLAFTEGRVLIGLRGPVVDGKAFILSADRQAFLAGRVERADLHALLLDGLSGIRSLEPLGAGVLVMTGRSQHGPADDGPCAGFDQGSLTQPALYYWGGPEEPGTLREVARFSEKKHQPEAVALLSEDEAGREIEILVFFGDQPDGAPVSYRIPFRRPPGH